MPDEQTSRFEPERDEEREIARLRPRAREAAVGTLGLLALVLLSFYFCAQFDSAFQRWVIVLGAAALAALLCAPTILRWASIRYRLTTRRILARRGVLRTRRGALEFTNDLEVTVSRSIAQRLTRCGDVRLARAGSTLFVLRDAPDPDLVAQVLGDCIAAAPGPDRPAPEAV